MRSSFTLLIKHMNTIDANKQVLLSRLSAMAKDAAVDGGDKETVQSFAPVLKQALDAVSYRQTHAGGLAKKFEQGDPGTSLPQVMVEMQKARVSFEALNQVRNKFVAAYQQIMSMPL